MDAEKIRHCVWLMCFGVRLMVSYESITVQAGTQVRNETLGCDLVLRFPKGDRDPPPFPRLKRRDAFRRNCPHGSGISKCRHAGEL